ncbi:MAG: phenylacetate--CoA ligase, partial [bacterium]|nr:phenylacetate--CoA ligase [bacterium]
SKQELVDDQLEHPPYGTNLTYPLERYTRFSQTSGTSSTSMRWLDTPESWQWMLDCWKRVYRSAGVTAADHILFAFSFGPFLGFWTAFEAGEQLGCLLVPGGGMRSGARLRALIDTVATVLCCTPTYAIRLAEVAAEEGIDLAAAAVKWIIVAGEPGGSIPATRERIEELWNEARVVDHHGMTEIGPVSYGCPKRPGVLHVIESAYVAEVVDPRTGQAVSRGATGELVLTNLGRTGSPILRYRTGDLVQPAPEGPCECGTGDLALEGGILGRADDMVVVRGVNIHPSTIEDLLHRFGEVAEYRVEISTAQALPELAIQVEPSADCGDVAGLIRRLETALAESIGLRINVASVASGTLPRFEMKAKRWNRI